MGGHDLIFEEGLAEIAKWVPCERESNVDVIAFCKTFFKCGMTVVEEPHGEIRRIFTIIGGDYCDPVFYREVDWPGPECFGRNVMSALGKDAVHPTKFPLGFSKADAGYDAKCGRSRSGIWSKYKGNIYLAPWIQSVESVVIVWDGIKKSWSDADLVNDDQDYKKALKLYLQYGHERDYGSAQAANLIHNIAKSGTFDEALADLTWACNERRKTRDTAICLQDLNFLGTKLIEVGLPVTDSGPAVYAHVGNIARGDANESAVAALVNGFSPLAVVVSGVNSDANDYDTVVGKDYHLYIAPYGGVHGAGADSNKFWPTPGDSDWSFDSLASYFRFFTALPSPQRYYDVCLGLIHFFFIDSSASEPDGNTETSVQAEWLKTKLLLSTAPWKVVVMADAPYSSVSQNADLRWPFKAWGADIILSGPAAYERIIKDSLTYIVNGEGGQQTAGSTTQISGSQFLDSGGQFGAGRLTVTETTLLYEFLNLSAAVIDSVTLTK